MWRVALILVLAVRAVAAEPPPPKCNAVALEKEGDDATSLGQHAVALDKYGKAVRCEITETRVLKAGIAACRAKNEKLAKLYYEKLRDQRNKDRLAQICMPGCRLEF